MTRYADCHVATYKNGQTRIEAEPGQVVVHWDTSHMIYAVSVDELTREELNDFVSWAENTWGNDREIEVMTRLNSDGTGDVWVETVA